MSFTKSVNYIRAMSFLSKVSVARSMLISVTEFNLFWPIVEGKYICYLPDRRSGWGAQARWGLGPFSRARAQFLPIWTDAAGK